MSYIITLFIIFLVILILIIYTSKGVFDNNFFKKVLALVFIFGLIYLLINKYYSGYYDPDIIHPASL